MGHEKNSSRKLAGEGCSLRRHEEEESEGAIMGNGAPARKLPPCALWHSANRGAV